jgi:hypothetical protein
VLSEPARAAARQWIFEPARVADQPVVSSVIIHFRFRASTAIPSKMSAAVSGSPTHP